MEGDKQPIVKTSLSELSLSQLIFLTGVAYNTIKVRLARLEPLRTDGKTIYYDPKKALPLIYEATPASEVRMDLDSEKKRLVSAQAEKAELELRRIRGELIPADLIEDTWSDLVTNFRARILAIPSKLALEVKGCETAAEVEGVLKKAVYEALGELSRYDPSPGNDEDDGEEGGDDGGATSGDDGQSVG